jgi:hypothetical protein
MRTKQYTFVWGQRLAEIYARLGRALPAPRLGVPAVDPRPTSGMARHRSLPAGAGYNTSVRAQAARRRANR